MFSLCKMYSRSQSFYSSYRFRPIFLLFVFCPLIVTKEIYFILYGGCKHVSKQRFQYTFQESPKPSDTQAKKLGNDLLAISGC